MFFFFRFFFSKIPTQFDTFSKFCSTAPPPKLPKPKPNAARLKSQSQPVTPHGTNPSSPTSLRSLDPRKVFTPATCVPDLHPQINRIHYHQGQKSPRFGHHPYQTASKSPRFRHLALEPGSGGGEAGRPKKKLPPCASRAVMRPGFLADGQPELQSTLLQPTPTAIQDPVDPSALPPPVIIPEARSLNIPRDPFECPVCASSVFLSDFVKHVKQNHVRVPVEAMQPGRACNVFIDPVLDEVARNRCRLLYLVTGKLR